MTTPFILEEEKDDDLPEDMEDFISINDSIFEDRFNVYDQSGKKIAHIEEDEG